MLHIDKKLLQFIISFERKFVLFDSLGFGLVGVLLANSSVERILSGKTTLPANTTHTQTHQ
jgi:hypothetical protein